MQHKNLIKTFEVEMWQYIDKTLPEERMNFWNEQISLDIELQQMLEDTEDTLQKYSELDNTNIEENKFLEMIDIAASRTSFRERVISFFATNEKQIIPKLAFGSILIIASVILLILSNKPNPINNITNPAFGWDDESINTEFVNISTKTVLLENEDLRKYYYYSKTKSEWDREIISIDKELNNLFEETKSREL